MDAEGVFCQGCWRSIEEIKRWSKSDDRQKKALWALIEQRMPQPRDTMPANRTYSTP